MRILNWLRRSNNPGHYGLEQLQGTYRGFSPTDESPIAMGELEVSITREAMKIRHATGLRVDEGEIPLSMLKPMTKKELSTVYQEGSEYIDKSVGFSVNGMQYVFIPNPNDDEFGLLIRGNQMADILGPTVLYSPAQVQKGVYEKIVAGLNGQFPDRYPRGCFPTLDAGGKLPE